MNAAHGAGPREARGEGAGDAEPARPEHDVAHTDVHAEGRRLQGTPAPKADGAPVLANERDVQRRAHGEDGGRLI